MKTKLFLAGLSLCFAGSVAQAQEHWCGSDHVRSEYYKEHPELYKEALETKKRLFEEARQNHTRFQKGFRKNNHAHSKQASAPDEYLIPVVFHIMHEGGSENISFAQIQDQLRIMNEDFARTNPDAGNTPDAFISLADRTLLSLIQNDVSAYTGQNSVLTFQKGTGNENQEGLGDRHSFYFTSTDSPEAPDFASMLPSGDDFDYTGATTEADSIELVFGTQHEINTNNLGNRVSLIKVLADELNGLGGFDAEVVIDGTKEQSLLEVTGTSLDILTQQEAYVNVYNGANEAYHFYFTQTGATAEPTTENGTNIAIDIEGLTSTDEIAAALHAAIDGLDDFDATISGSQITIENTLEGDATNAGPNGLLGSSLSATTVTDGVINDNPDDNEFGARMTINNLDVGAATQKVYNMIGAVEANEIIKGGFIAATTKIRFELAKIDPDGNCTNGVNRFFTRKTNNARNSVKALNQWDPHKYLNIWVVKTIESLGGDGGTTLGYAQFPEQLASSPETDGLVIRSDYLGSIEDAAGRVGRTATHEIGHWLGLRHIWGDDDFDAEGNLLTPPFSDSDIDQLCGGDDGVEDTPLQGTRNYGAPTYPHASECHELYYGDMFMNYMDYVNDNVMNAFSKGQEAVMENVLNTIRTEIWSEENLIATGLKDFNEGACVPFVADFDANRRWICEGSSVNYSSDVFYGDGASYQWYLPGSNDENATSENPSVNYNTPGYYEAQLTVTNANGAGVKVRKQMIHVIGDDAVLTSPLAEGFSQWQFPNIEGKPYFASHMNDENEGFWHYNGYVNGNLSTDQQGALRVRTQDFDTDEPRYLVFPNIDLSAHSGDIDLYFEYAYAKRSNLTEDFIDVRLIEGCGTSSADWITPRSVPSEDDIIRGFHSEDEHTVTNGGGFVYFDFVPTSEDWKTAHMRFRLPNSASAKSNMTLYFEIYGNKGEGNFFYLDNVSLGTGLNVSDFTPAALGLEVYPNPTTDDATIAFNLVKDGNVQIAIHDVIGKQVGTFAQDMNAQQHKINLSQLNNNLKAGVYFVQLNVDGVVTTKKVVISE